MLNSKQKMRLMNGGFFTVLIQHDWLLIFQKMNFLLRMWWICFYILFCKLQKKMETCIFQLGNFYFPIFSFGLLLFFNQFCFRVHGLIFSYTQIIQGFEFVFLPSQFFCLEDQIGCFPT
jgi:hypothetical protein